ncbi:thiol reductant ABC exporter subunit CydC [Cereibacter sphaeroides]|nr:thiol reductant ABC exporter subunit CydC [Cereibacter sphaeroides]
MIRVLRALMAGQGRALAWGGLLAVLVLAMGAALLGLSGWFITAASAAGLAGTGVLFDVFRPSAGVRFLAIGRTAARYGERVLTHDAVLRAIAALRVRLIAAQAAAPFEALARLRSAEALNRLGADVEVLEGLLLRLVVPIVAGAMVLAGAFLFLWWLVDLRVALWVAGGLSLGGALVFLLGTGVARRPSEGVEALAQAMRRRFLELLQARDALALDGAIPARQAALAALEAERRATARRLDRIERLSGAALSLMVAAAVAGALWLGGTAVLRGDYAPASAAIGLFVALALAEALAPLRRALSDLGRMRQAAARVAPRLDHAPPPEGLPCPAAPVLSFDDVTFRRADRSAPVLDGITFQLAPGERVALSGPSGSGKSTILHLAAGLISAEAGAVRLGQTPVNRIDGPALRRAVTLVPQRTTLVQGSVAENLRLAAPEAGDAALWQALEAAQLAQVIRDKGGLEARLGPRGAGLSGGESRRLALARALLRRPEILLLDEPTEGLDRPTAEALLEGIAAFLPQATLLIAAHRPAERAFAQRLLTLTAQGHLTATQSR